MSFMQAIADRFTASVEAASQELMIRVESLSSDVSEHPSCSRIQTAKALFEKRVVDATNQMEAHRQWLADEFRNLDAHWYGKVLTNVAQTESGSFTPHKMLHDQSADLALVMRALAAQNQRRTCLKGMRLQIQDIGE